MLVRVCLYCVISSGSPSRQVRVWFPQLLLRVALPFFALPFCFAPASRVFLSPCRKKNMQPPIKKTEAMDEGAHRRVDDQARHDQACVDAVADSIGSMFVGHSPMENAPLDILFEVRIRARRRKFRAGSCSPRCQMFPPPPKYSHPLLPRGTSRR